MTTIADSLIPSVKIEELLRRRNEIAGKLALAHSAIREGIQLSEATFGERVRYRAMDLYDRNAHACFSDEDGLPRFVKRVDAMAWDHLLSESGLWTFMDAQARKKWSETIAELDVPELTLANILATFTELYAQRGDMFERGVIAVFKALSWDYKLNLPHMFGSRIVMRHVVHTFPRKSGGREIVGLEHDGANRLDDLCRVLLLLDKKPEPDHRNAAYRTLSELEWPKKVATAELYGVVKLRGFQNGNAHVMFLRPDLVQLMNRIVAKHFPKALPPSTEDA